MINDYIKKYHPARKFHDQMVTYLDEYTEYLLLVKSNGTSVSHGDIIHQFINYLFNHHLVSDINQIKVSMANSGFYSEYKKMNEGYITGGEIKGILKDFFIFLYGKYGIKNERVVKGLDK